MKKEVFDFYDRTSLKSYNLDKTMQDQLNALGSLDVFTRQHCENVAAITCRICEYLHCSKSFTEYCTICAYLHDIGKIFIPPEILQKPAKLTDEEYEVIKTHTTIGYQMCMRDLKLRPYAAGPYYHHEALNGTGYPQGLTKKDIPYEGQIIRVADEYDAIVSKRQYKSHVGISDTIKILIDNAQPTHQIKSSEVLQKIADSVELGKNNPTIVKALIKVILDDVYYEITCSQDYVDYLAENLKRFERIEKLYNKYINAKNDDKKNYYLEYMKLYFTENENVDNFHKIWDDYKSAYELRKTKIDNLYNEAKIIKKLKV